MPFEEKVGIVGIVELLDELLDEWRDELWEARIEGMEVPSNDFVFVKVGPGGTPDPNLAFSPIFTTLGVMTGTSLDE